MENKILEFLLDPTIKRIAIVILAAILIVLLSRFIKNKSREFIKDNDSRYRFKKVVSFFNYLLIIILISIVFSDKLGGLTVAFGVAGAGIAFALQEVIVSVAGWLAISFSNFYRVGDRVQLGGIIGDVIDISILRTTVMECRQWVDGDQYNGRIVRISNSNVFKDAVFNYSADFPFIWDEITIPIKFGSDVNLAQTVLEKVANQELIDFAKIAKEDWKVMVDKYRIENAKVEPSVFISIKDNWIEFALRYVVDYKKRRSTKDRLSRKIIEEVNKSDEKIQLA